MKTAALGCCMSALLKIWVISQYPVNKLKRKLFHYFSRCSEVLLEMTFF